MKVSKLLLGILVLVFCGFALTALQTSSLQAYTLPDTGQTKCYDNSDNITCPSLGQTFYGQDGNYQGAQPAYKDNGDGTVTDLNTRLMWEQGDDQNFYVNNQPNRTWQEAEFYCQNLFLGGYNDWRLPTRRELVSIVDFSKYNPAINTHIFSRAKGNSYWSNSSTYYQDNFWPVHFWSGSIVVYYSPTVTGTGFVRCTRGAVLPENAYKDNNDSGAVTDINTALMWQQTDDAQKRTWLDALGYCENLSLAGYSDWRLPNIRELESLINYSTTQPAINTDYFPSTQYSCQHHAPYWSSSTDLAYNNSFHPDYAWSADFSWGWTYTMEKNVISAYVRCVRRGVTPPKPSLTVTVDPVAGGKVTGTGIDCGSDCTQSYNLGRKVKLTATRNPGYKFKYWDDGTTQYTQNPITITMDSNKTLTAKFGWPTIAQSPMSGQPGTTFVQWGTDFTPNKTATLHIKKPDGSEYTPQTVKLDKFGHFEIPYTSSASKPIGIYTWWVIDNATKRKSNEVSYEIIQPTAKCSAPQRNKALFKIKNPTCRDRWNLEIFYSELYKGLIQITQDFIMDQVEGVLDLNKSINHVIAGYSAIKDLYSIPQLSGKDPSELFAIGGTKSGELISSLITNEYGTILFTSLGAATKAISGDWEGAIEDELTLSFSALNNAMAAVTVTILTKRFQEHQIAKTFVIELFRYGSQMDKVAIYHKLSSKATMIDIITAIGKEIGATNPWYWFDDYDILNVVNHVVDNLNITYTKQAEYTK